MGSKFQYFVYFNNALGLDQSYCCENRNFLKFSLFIACYKGKYPETWLVNLPKETNS